MKRATSFGGRDLQRVGRIVAGQHHAVAVHDQTPVGDDRQDGGAVGFGSRSQLVVAHDLQHHCTPAQQEQGQHDAHPHDEQPVAKSRQLQFDVLDLGHGWWIGV